MQLFDNKKVNTHWRNNLILFICILVLFMIGPSIKFVKESKVIISIFFTLLILSSIFVLEYKPLTQKILRIIGFLVLVVIWVDAIFSTQLLDVISSVLISLFLFIITVSLIIHVATSKDVNANIIFSSINGYLLLGIIGGLTLIIMEKILQTELLNNVLSNSFADYMYFSFVTLTTLGYGDITPASSGGKVIAMLLSTTGQLYMAILIAMLVGKYISKTRSEK